MKFYFQIFLSVILGSLLGIALYNKLYTKNSATTASDIVTDLSLLADHIDFAKIKREADSLAYIKHQDSLQRAILFVETESVKPAEKKAIPKVNTKAVVNITRPENIAKPKVAVQAKLKLAELKKKNIITIPVTEIPAPEKIEVAAIAKASPAAEPGKSVADGTAQIQPQADKKKKFLFFNKKNNSN
jgi:hypothetical protein